MNPLLFADNCRTGGEVMKILNQKIGKKDIFDNSEIVFDDCMVKAVVDIKRELVAVDAGLHADLEELLLEDGSAQDDLWGINFYPEDEEFIEFDSLINIRPRQGNRSRGVEDENTRQKIIEVVEKWIQ